MNKNNKRLLIASLGFVVFGIAFGVITNFIDSSKSIKETTSSFKVYISEANLDGVNVTKNISDSGRGITFNPTTVDGLVSTLSMKIKNESTEYKTKVVISCKMEASSSYELELPQQLVVDESSTIDTFVNIRALRNVVEPNDVRCTLNVRAVERVK